MDILMNNLNRISTMLKITGDELKKADDKTLSARPGENKWSKKEVIGHLCDSAVNNLSRFIRAQSEPQPFNVVTYSQNEWVALNHYNEMSINDILDYWQSLNRQIIHIVRNIPEDKLAIECSLGNAAFREDGETKTLLWLFEDYVVHMEHHLAQI